MFDSLNVNAPLRDRLARESGLEAALDAATAAIAASPLRVRTASFLSWGQHCVECAAPACYRTCGLYEKGPDGRCRTFRYGIARNDRLTSIHPSSMEFAFKPHAVLFTHLTLRQFPLARIAREEAVRARLTERIARTLDAPLRAAGARTFFQRVLARLDFERLRSLEGVSPERLVARGEPLPDGFLLQVFSTAAEPFDLALQIVVEPRRPDDRAFLETVRLEPGFNEAFVPFEDVAEVVDFGRGARVSVWSPEGRGDPLVVLAADLVGLEPPAISDADARRPPVKCVVFDLDRTLWDGVLLEDGDRVRLRPGMRRLLSTFDRRGVLLSVASKNDRESAMRRLEELGVADFFLHPRIDWNPKGSNLRAIAADLNIGLDTVAFVDDQAFEREEVARAVPEVRVLSERELPLLARRPDMQGSDTEEARRRRALYRENRARREAEVAALGGSAAEAARAEDYEAFLRDCRIVLRIERADPDDAARFERLHELTQRTNQLNFSGTRYSREALAAILRDPSRECRALLVRDRFGDHGLVGFSVVDRNDRARPRLIDLALSCRVQARRVEHAFLSWLARRHANEGATALEAVYRRTERNAPAGRVFEDLGFRLLESAPERPASPDASPATRMLLELPLGTTIPEVSLVGLEDADDLAVGRS